MTNYYLPEIKCNLIYRTNNDQFHFCLLAFFHVGDKIYYLLNPKLIYQQILIQKSIIQSEDREINKLDLALVLKQSLSRFIFLNFVDLLHL